VYFSDVVTFKHPFHGVLAEHLDNSSVGRLNMTRFRVFGPDENTSNKLQDIYEVSKKFWIAESFPEDADGGELTYPSRRIDGHADFLLWQRSSVGRPIRRLRL
jgi:hypothetical protein